MKLRPALTGSSDFVTNIINLTLTTFGSQSASTTLGTWWANAADHTALLSKSNGFDFVKGCEYYCDHAFDQLTDDWDTSGSNPQRQILFFIIDSAGAELYQVGANTIAGGLAGVPASNGTNISFTIPAHSTPGSGLKARFVVNAVGAVAAEIRENWTFFGRYLP